MEEEYSSVVEERERLEEEYSSVVEERERLEGEMVQLKETVSSLQCERENTDNKLAKVSENLKKVRVFPLSLANACTILRLNWHLSKPLLDPQYPYIIIYREISHCAHRISQIIYN